MSYNGSGVFNINTAGQPVVTGTVISSTAFNALTADLATGLTTALTKDGQTTPTANIPMGGYKITGIAAATTLGDALSYGRAATVSTLTNSALTSGRVPYASTAGLLVDSANLLYSGINLTLNGLLDISGASGGQIKFPATQNLSSDANTLDDYEEGTWTPNVTFGGGSTGITYAGYQGGKYTRIGNRVFFTAQMRLTNKGSSTGNASITGLPFASAGGNQGIGSVCFFVDSLTFTTTVAGQVDLDAATITMYSVVSGGSSTILTNAEFSNTTNVKMMGHYYTTA